MDTTAVLRAVQSLPIEERLDLLFQMWDQLVEDGWAPTLTDELSAELDRRWAEHVANPDNGLTWEQVVAYVKQPR